MPLSGGGKSTRFDLNIEAVNLEPVEEDFEDIEIEDEDIIKIKQLASDPDIYNKLIKSIAPTIYGYDEIKLALALQLFGGYKKIAPDGTKIRGDIHILLIGDPGAGKSQLLKYIQKLAPKSRFVSGKGASAAGLTATVTKDDYLKAWSVEAGVLVLASNGVALIDELDKINKEDIQALYEAMEQQTVSIAKASINTTLKAECSILAAANPKFGRFDPYLSIAEQINLPPPLLTRFDLIFTVLDIPDKKKDKEIAKHILRVHLNKGEKPAIDLQLLKKWIVYAKQKIKPVMSEEAAKLIEEYYTKVRNMANENGKIVSIPITTRQLEAIVRLAEASARVRLSNEINIEDAKRAIDLVEKSLRKIGYDPETGKIDIDRITGMGAT
ncbi:TPA: AAA family ATPase, partial [Candidatus Micrarchaeota archaeon]|nr:AAA family ATPase [Candidatus Micrarchaeota archaeon]